MAGDTMRRMVPYAVWGWDPTGSPPTADELRQLRPTVEQSLGFSLGEPRFGQLGELPPPRVRLAAALEPLGSDDPADRARHAIGRSYLDLLRGLNGAVEPVPDLVVRPTTPAEVEQVLAWAGDAGAGVVPFGGGSSVVGGVGPVPAAAERPVISLDLQRLSGVLEVDRTSRAARIAAGTLGPAVDAALRPDGLSLRFFPQSYEQSTVGGWLATRAAGHYATKLQHIDDLVESITACTPVGWWESRRLPGSGAGPSPDRMLLGSEGSLGVITEAWLRVQDRPRHRATASLVAGSFPSGADAVRLLLQSGLAPATCRLIDGVEATTSGAPGVAAGEALLVLGAESASHPVEDELEAAVAVVEEAGLRRLPPTSSAGDAWRNAFKAAPLLRERLALLGVIVETFETAVPWAHFPALHREVTAAVENALHEICGGGRVTCRLTHAYPDGCAPYFTVLAPGRPGSEAGQWRDIKSAASDAVLGAGGTITHHHAVGRDHAPWYGQQRPPVFAAALAGARHAVDPTGLMNPGLWDTDSDMHYR
ncbi:MAG: alkyldihydroxyacetonephosphate synthase [Frankiaceae bacterium]|nr:alkyldihydroxyacetonephosphate synthase [Frankiaceae bacterium]